MGALVYMTKGDVSILDAQGSSLPIEVKVTKVFASHRIETAAHSAVDLFLYDGSLIRVYQNTKLVVSDILQDASGRTESTVSLATGKIFVKSGGKLPKDRTVRVETATTVAGIRGTEFIVEDLGGDAKILVGEGSVLGEHKTSGKTYEIDPGHKLEVQNQSPSLVPMTDEETTAFREDSKNANDLLSAGRLDIQNLMKQFQEERQKMIEALENKKTENQELLDQQKNKDRELLDAQKQKDRETMDRVKTGTGTQKQEVEDKTKDELNKLQDGTKSEMEKLKSGFKNPQ